MSTQQVYELEITEADDTLALLMQLMYQMRGRSEANMEPFMVTVCDKRRQGMNSPYHVSNIGLYVRGIEIVNKTHVTLTGHIPDGDSCWNEGIKDPIPGWLRSEMSEHGASNRFMGWIDCDNSVGHLRFVKQS